VFEDMPALRLGVPPDAWHASRPWGAVSMVSETRHRLGMAFPRAEDLGHPVWQSATGMLRRRNDGRGE
jgi:hypothetical protein